MFELFDVLGDSLSGIAPSLLLVVGFVTGLRHAMEADHVAAVTILVSKYRKLSKASMLGALWGFGHTLALFATGLAVLLLAISIPIKLALLLEFGVGIMLIVLGLSVIRGVRRNKLIDYLFGIFATRHMHPHAHGNRIHIHPHNHDREHHHCHKSLIVGIIHGLAGSGALMLLVLSTVNSVINGLAYIALFGIGSIMGMLVLSTVVGMPVVFTASRFGRINRYIRTISAVVSIALGISIMYEIGIIEQLFII
ncbi:MAG: urease accessory protein UreH [Nitrososphaerales archaeon]